MDEPMTIVNFVATSVSQKFLICSKDRSERECHRTSSSRLKTSNLLASAQLDFSRLLSGREMESLSERKVCLNSETHFFLNSSPANSAFLMRKVP